MTRNINGKVSTRAHITRNIRASQFPEDETTTMRSSENIVRRDEGTLSPLNNKEREGKRRRERERKTEGGREREREASMRTRIRVDGTKRGKMPGVRPITQADGANQGAMRLP